MLVLVMIPTAYEILTKLSMCLPASMKLAKFKHYQLDIRISPLPIIEKLARMRMATRFEGGSRLARVNFFPNGEQRVHEKEREKTRRNSFNLASKSTRNHRPDRYAFHKQIKKERKKGEAECKIVKRMQSARV